MTPEHKTPEYKLKDFDEILFEALRDPESAAIYLQDAWEDSVEEFLIALRKYVQANGGMAQCAERAHISREALYRMLSETGNPELRSIRAVLQANGLGFSIAGRSET
ncbi:MAG: putative addiction module antidote protein [Armatimonadota bacterium]|nr:putative addiction module antidote protein [Armatimonadota bacterium]